MSASGGATGGATGGGAAGSSPGDAAGGAAGGAWAGPVALLLGLGWLGFALTDLDVFPHVSGWRSAAGAPPALHVAAFGALLPGVAFGLYGLRRTAGRGPSGLCALAALLLLAPFVLDAALFFIGTPAVSPTLRAGVFVAAHIGVALLLLATWWRGRRGRSHRASPARAATRGPRWLLRGGLLLLSLAGAALLAEGVFRVLELRPYRNPTLIIPGDERRILLSEIALFRPYGKPGEREGPAARFRPYLYLKGWYDRPQWDYFDAQDCVDYVFNRWGLRDHDFELEKQPGEFRVVAIGDSFTFGVGAQLEDCWTEVLERGLAQRRGGPVEVINAGFASGHNMGMYADWIVKDGVALQPDVLVVGFCLNDMHREVEMYAYELFDPQPLLGGRSLLVNWVQRHALQLGRPRSGPLSFTHHVTAEPAQWEACRAALLRCKAALEAAGIRFVVVPFPMLSGLREPEYPYEELLAMVRDFCASAGIECVDLRPVLLGQQDETLWAHPTDQHPNDRGHRLIGEGVLEALFPR